MSQAYFPGWRATLNDEVIPLHRDVETGLTRLELPANTTGTLEICPWYDPAAYRGLAHQLRGACGGTCRECGPLACTVSTT